MRFGAVLLLLVAGGAALAAGQTIPLPPDSSRFSYLVPASVFGYTTVPMGFYFSDITDETELTVRAMASLAGTDSEGGWLATGFRSVTGSNTCPTGMASAGFPLDAGIGLINNGSVWDVFATAGGVQPPQDTTNSLRDASSGVQDGWSFVEFTRDLSTGDGQDVPIATGTTTTCIQAAFGQLGGSPDTIQGHDPDARFRGAGLEFSNPAACGGVGLVGCMDCVNPPEIPANVTRCWNDQGICNLGTGTCVGCPSPMTGDYCHRLEPMDLTRLTPDSSQQGEDPKEITVQAETATVVLSSELTINYTCQFTARNGGQVYSQPLLLDLGTLTTTLPPGLAQGRYDVTCSNDGFTFSGEKRVYDVTAPPREPFNWQLPAAIAGGSVVLVGLVYGGLVASRSARAAWAVKRKERIAASRKKRMSQKKAAEAKKKKEKEEALFRPLTNTETKEADAKSKRRLSSTSGNSAGSNNSGYGAGGYGSGAGSRPKASKSVTSGGKQQRPRASSSKTSKSRKSNKPRAPRTAAGKAAASGAKK